MFFSHQWCHPSLLRPAKRIEAPVGDPGFMTSASSGAAQVDKYCNINTTVIGDYHKPKVRLPGAGGAPEISGSAKKVLIILNPSHRAFVEK